MKKNQVISYNYQNAVIYYVHEFIQNLSQVSLKYKYVKAPTIFHRFIHGTYNYNFLFAEPSEAIDDQNQL